MSWLSRFCPDKTEIKKIDDPLPAGQRLERSLQSERDKLKSRVAFLEKELVKEKTISMSLLEKIESMSSWIPFDEFIEKDHLQDELLALMPSGAVVRFSYKAGREYMHPHAFHGGKLIGKPKAVQVLKFNE